MRLLWGIKGKGAISNKEIVFVSAEERPTASCARQNTIDVVDTENTDFLKRKGLPYYESPVYIDQKEVALRCGFLPHFIIGFMVGSKFYVNPAISRSMDKMQEMKSFQELNAFKHQLIMYGLDVDQTNFEEFCKMTKFKRYYTFDGRYYEIHCLDIAR